MSGMPQPNRYRYLGDWIISRSESIIGGFQIGICANVIRQEQLGYRLNNEDVRRILARYKEHVSFWNTGLDVIRSELQMLADSMGRSFYEIATLFDSLEPRRIPPEIMYTLARIRKDVFVPNPQNPNIGHWAAEDFSQDEISRIQMSMFSGYPAASLQLLTPQNLCELRGVFTRGDLEQVLHNAAQQQEYFEGRTVRYQIFTLT